MRTKNQVMPQSVSGSGVVSRNSKVADRIQDTVGVSYAARDGVRSGPLHPEIARICAWRACAAERRMIIFDIAGKHWAELTESHCNRISWLSSLQ